MDDVTGERVNWKRGASYRVTSSNKRGKAGLSWLRIRIRGGQFKRSDKPSVSIKYSKFLEILKT
jgi:hypothetical protein